MRGAGPLRDQATEIDDAHDPVACGRRRKIARRLGIDFRELFAGRHRMHEVVSRVDAGQDPVERLRS